MPNQALLKRFSRYLILFLFPVIGYAQTMTQEMKSGLMDQIVDAQLQQLVRARSGYVSEAEAQDVPLAPAQQKKCGPKWAGGCWDIHKKQLGYKETLFKPSFYLLFSGLVATNILDVRLSQGCGERHDFGQRVSVGEHLKRDLPIDFAVGTMAFFLKRGHIKIIPEAMLSYGIVVHVKGAVEGYNAHCN